MAEDLKSNTNMPWGDIRGVITGRENTIAAKEVDIQPHKTESPKCGKPCAHAGLSMR